MEAMLQDLWAAAKQAGPFATMLMIFMWARTDAERRVLQKERDALLERVIKAIDTTADAVTDAIRVGTTKGRS